MIYFILFLLNKFINIQFTENLLHKYEKYQINKFISKKIKPIKIPTINKSELSNDLFIKLSNNFRNPVLIKGFLKDTNAVNNWDKDYLKNIYWRFQNKYFK